MNHYICEKCGHLFNPTNSELDAMLDDNKPLLCKDCSPKFRITRDREYCGGGVWLVRIRDEKAWWIGKATTRNAYSDVYRGFRWEHRDNLGRHFATTLKQLVRTMIKDIETRETYANDSK